jgi:hypothetical protein
MISERDEREREREKSSKTELTDIMIEEGH